MKSYTLIFFFIFVSFISLPTSAWANSAENTYKTVCAVCHTAGVADAPKLGDKTKWAPLIKEGQVQLVAHGYVGVRGMPAKGGKPDLSVQDFAASVVYIVNQSGGSWQNPDASTLKKIDAEIVRRQAQLRK
jgi:mono/diheme cytochrome c family protein